MMASAKKLASNASKDSADIVGISFLFLTSSLTRYCVSMGSGELILVVVVVVVVVGHAEEEAEEFWWFTLFTFFILFYFLNRE